MPLIWHGDDAESHRRRAFIVNSFSSLLVSNTQPWESRYVCYCLDSAKTIDETLDGIDTWIVWSLTELMHGRYLGHGPHSEPVECRKGMDGQQLANGYRAILVCHRGDEKYLQRAYHVNGVGWQSKQCCWTCKASRVPTSPYLYTHFGRHAPHRQSMIDTPSFIASCRANAWVRLPGWHVEVLTYDILHVFDLSLVCDAAASVS